MAYEELLRHHQDAALRTAALLTHDPDEAQDAVQEAFVKAHAALGRFRAGAAFRPWILRIVANEARNRRRSAGRREGLALRLIEDRREDDAAPSPETAVLVHERREALLGALARLREDDRLVLGYRFFLDLGEAETAEALGIPRGTVKSRQSRAIERLRAVLGTGGGA
jgi:RNA polymerase sigma-70 factor (ECF subfamily)